MTEAVWPRLYLDTNVFIFAFERQEPIQNRLLRLFGGSTPQQFHLVTSELTLAEALVVPVRNYRSGLTRERERGQRLVEQYQGFITTLKGMSVVPVTRDILIRASFLRAEKGRLKLPDAIHLAIAEAEKCDTFVSGDSDLMSVVQMERVRFIEADLDRLLARLNR